jgi:hypothetical protein
MEEADTEAVLVAAVDTKEAADLEVADTEGADTEVAVDGKEGVDLEAADSEAADTEVAVDGKEVADLEAADSEAADTEVAVVRLDTRYIIWLLAFSLLMSYIYGAPCKARNFNVVYIWTYVWQR